MEECKEPMELRKSTETCDEAKAEASDSALSDEDCEQVVGGAGFLPGNNP